jgi:hypothetical protein
MTARTDDYDEIVRVVQLYVDGLMTTISASSRRLLRKTLGSSSSMPTAVFTKT